MQLRSVLSKYYNKEPGQCLGKQPICTYLKWYKKSEQNLEGFQMQWVFLSFIQTLPRCAQLLANSKRSQMK